jgi:hypothetical protein
MRPLREQTVGEIKERHDEIDACVVDLTPRVELSEAARGSLVCDQESDSVAAESDDASDPIEFITENGFSIVRPWESGDSPRPTGSRCRFGVSDGFIEREVTVEISPCVVTEISLRTRGRVQLTNAFWISCAERHVANYVSEHGDFPDGDELIVARLNCEDILLALRWDKSDE